ncbi:GntR family transcriptional regulator [Mycolicibacterium mageritense DSM 44476 = CIP 104973]|uniref:GntR family transcriptional regulator n=1 Tax=Mycolicibacterium mageritense TaxID=53462 RepID=A0AAI8TTI6_MYCME|nr:GntR family transcriptional regulator [Mycolicibacterium mageritense]MBN3454724.1 GntR family transcriptional regulator [Mycobacterium sp. DSM 3803]OKH82568.1 GntR family transcriptional regulator [Mycobacterium sp. SWH-M3]MCC9180264.1 GntR family transcriptional regulator [Mycolicibacterium mageritense]TXI65003.1 MAG: GntR family transcriptional regulator [Mycolicibacterium mageritense]CDO22807.1 GntR family transcriptional regulator [Mycolicibacterium mageritense DSM 44476 = CIP 104973]
MAAQSEELRRRIVADINAGAPGAKLGSERDLAERYGTSRSSLRQVLSALEEAGLVHRVIGRSGGIFISHGQVERNLSDVVGVPAFLANQGYVAGTRVLSTRITTPDQATQTALRLGPGDYVVEIHRVRLADGSPISLEHAQFPAERFPGLLEQQLGGSLYEVLQSKYGLETMRADERIEAVTATSNEATLLGIKPKSALLMITRVAYDQDGSPCEFSRDLFRGDRTALAVTAQGRGIAAQSDTNTASVTLQRQAG